MSDIVHKLRKLADFELPGRYQLIYLEAADRIAELEVKNAELEAKVESLKFEAQGSKQRVLR